MLKLFFLHKDPLNLLFGPKMGRLEHLSPPSGNERNYTNTANITSQVKWNKSQVNCLHARKYSVFFPLFWQRRTLVATLFQLSLRNTVLFAAMHERQASVNRDNGPERVQARRAERKLSNAPHFFFKKIVTGDGFFGVSNSENWHI